MPHPGSLLLRTALVAVKQWRRSASRGACNISSVIRSDHDGNIRAHTEVGVCAGGESGLNQRRDGGRVASGHDRIGACSHACLEWQPAVAVRADDHSAGLIAARRRGSWRVECGNGAGAESADWNAQQFCDHHRPARDQAVAGRCWQMVMRERARGQPCACPARDRAPRRDASRWCRDWRSRC